MVSDFRKKKYMHVFNTFLDTDHKGNVSKQDFIAANVKLANLRGYKAGEVVHDLMKDLLNQIWKGLIAQADTDGDGVVNAEEWVKLWDDYAKNPAGAAEWQQLYCKCIFQLEDATNDGSIDAEEFSNVFESFGRDKSKSIEAFKKFAQGKDSINWEQFEKLWQEYYSSENPSDPGNFIFGTLD